MVWKKTINKHAKKKTEDNTFSLNVIVSSSILRTNRANAPEASRTSKLHKARHCYNNLLNVKFRNRQLQNKHDSRTYIAHGSVLCNNPCPNPTQGRLMRSDITATPVAVLVLSENPDPHRGHKRSAASRRIVGKIKETLKAAAGVSQPEILSPAHKNSFVYDCSITAAIVQQHSGSFHEHVEQIYQMHFVTLHKQGERKANMQLSLLCMLVCTFSLAGRDLKDKK